MKVMRYVPRATLSQICESLPRREKGEDGQARMRTDDGRKLERTRNTDNNLPDIEGNDI